jgi:hypothetical protein
MRKQILAASALALVLALPANAANVTLDPTGTIVTGVYAMPQTFSVVIPDNDARLVAWQAARAVPQTFANALAAGLAVASTATPALNGSYAVDAGAQAAIAAVVTGVAAGEGLPGGGSTFVFMDASGAPHSFNQAQFVSLAAAIRNYLYALDLYAAGQGALPAASVTIP